MNNQAPTPQYQGRNPPLLTILEFRLMVAMAHWKL
jgi:hypothetical protein